mmetsp:Transcript_975/g.2323  ORF Transcript_975/g.2323 Transcript_975/m.2323 type:complete len:80 (+) Transcript_975:249-488(+)|eukprot:CAMPEP_0171540116 /NCGR_PEP_ID=MMETSP0960-20121227/1004_1 /TAXON_ID=87120 /ORGANISM="Aurantiochytrium limacinum, Strain ATCCMYA-1381" /LENGTH=79 /DNA_ID=CAMNT_0012087253 /DNA_START=163 /DNA_END=402 /DNA_ORIENTATION=+
MSNQALTVGPSAEDEANNNNEVPCKGAPTDAPDPENENSDLETEAPDLENDALDSENEGDVLESSHTDFNGMGTINTIN